ncbi:MAG: PDZ domain-containing protein [Bacteroidetes bacterium]|jgi:carboxyl-terminal processing protease|nr:PDZ domain-containing protein [Bacteroidota bacterium]
MKRVKLIYVPVLLSIACVIGIYIGALFNVSSPVSSIKLYKQKQKLNTLIQLIENKYVDQVDTDSIVDLTISQIIQDLDPHTAYLPKAELDAENQSMNGSFVGIGISFYKNNDTLTVIRTIPKGPSDKAGLKSGDKILYADGLNLSQPEITSDSIVKLLKGERLTEVNLKVKRDKQENLLSFKVKRNSVSLKSVDAGFMIDSSTAYIKINRFAKTTYDEFKAYAKTLESKNPQRIIVDIRDNGGGYLKEAVDVADEFLADDTPVLYTKDRGGNMSETLATAQGLFENKKVIILINEKSASASEILAGAIQDNDRGLIVGRRSFGKGLVQRIMPLGDGSAVRLTVARYYTPTGRSIQRSYNNGREDYFNDYMSRYTNGELQSADSIDVVDSLAFKTPKGKTVYGGGGIIPDVFVPKEMGNVNTDLHDMFEAGILDRFIFSELEKNRSYYNSLNVEDFLSYYQVSQSMLVAFDDFLQSFDIKYEEDELTQSTIKTYLKATIAQQLFNTNLAYQIIVKKDVMVMKALNIKSQLSNPNLLQ